MCIYLWILNMDRNYLPLRNMFKPLLVAVICLVLYLITLTLPFNNRPRIIAYPTKETLSPVSTVLTSTSNSNSAEQQDAKSEDKDPVPRCSQEDRLKLLQHHCKSAQTPVSIKKTGKTSIYDNIYVDEKHQIVTCIPPKAGCSTWKTILANNTFDTPLPKSFRTYSLHFGALQQRFHIHNLLHYNASMRQHFLTSDKYFRFILVRHPLERLHSGYVNKFVSGIDMALQKKYGGMILRKYHPELSTTVQNSGKGVTFEEFVRFLKEPKMLNPHWEPIVNLCQPCLVNYHAIVKTETMDEDNAVIIAKYLLPYTRGLGTANNVVAGGPQTDSLTQTGRKFEEFQTLSEEQMIFLQQRFQKDLDYFGYTWSIRRNESGSYALYSSCVNGALTKTCC